MTPLQFVLPGSIEQRTGGYVYDARLVAGLRSSGRAVHVHELPADFPNPGQASRDAADACYAQFDDGDLVLSDALAGSTLPTLMQRHRDRLRLVALVHHPLAFESGLDNATAARLARDERAALACVRHVVCTSEATARALQDYDVAARNVTVAVPGTDAAALAHGSAAGASVRILCVATLTPRKGHDVLIDAFAALHARRPALDWQLELVGSTRRAPHTADSVRAAIEQHALGQRITLHGELDAEALDAQYRNADAFVLASRHEGFGMVLHEALARGLPLVATRGGAIAETVPDGAGLLVDVDDVAALSDALQTIIERGATFEALKARAIEAREHLPRWDDTVRTVDDVLHRMSLEGTP